MERGKPPRVFFFFVEDFKGKNGLGVERQFRVSLAREEFVIEGNGVAPNGVASKRDGEYSNGDCCSRELIALASMGA